MKGVNELEWQELQNVYGGRTFGGLVLAKTAIVLESITETNAETPEELRDDFDEALKLLENDDEVSLQVLQEIVFLVSQLWDRGTEIFDVLTLIEATLMGELVAGRLAILAEQAGKSVESL